jgi:hypothetical protein
MATEGIFANMAGFGAESDDEYDDDEYEFDDDTEIHPDMLAQLMAAMGGDEAAAEGLPAGFMETMLASMQGMAPGDDGPESDWSEDGEGGVEEDDY